MSRSTEITGLRGRERLAAAWKERSYPVLCLCWGGLGLLLSLARILGESAPFGVALAAAAPLPLVLPAAAGGMVGYLMGGGMAADFSRVGALLLAAMARWVAGPRWEKHRGWAGPLLAGSAVFAAGVAPLLYGSPLIYDVVMWVTQVVMGGASAAFLERGAGVLSRRSLPEDRLDAAALAVTGALVLMGLEAVDLGGVTLGRAFGVLAVLFAARVGGEALSAAAGLVCGLALGFSRGDFSLSVTVYGLGPSGGDLLRLRAHRQHPGLPRDLRRGERHDGLEPRRLCRGGAGGGALPHGAGPVVPAGGGRPAPRRRR